MNASQNSSTIGINLNTINIDIVVDLLSINYDVSDCLQNCSNKGECTIDAVNKNSSVFALRITLDPSVKQV